MPSAEKQSIVKNLTDVLLANKPLPLPNISPFCSLDIQSQLYRLVVIQDLDFQLVGPNVFWDEVCWLPEAAPL